MDAQGGHAPMAEALCARRTKPAEHRLFMQRTSNIFKAQRKRAKKAGQQLDYSLADLRAWVRHKLDTGDACWYCNQPLQVATFSVDHCEPISRGGNFLAI